MDTIKLLAKGEWRKMDKKIFISASYYKQRYYANPEFDDVPVEIRNEMRALCIMLAEKLHGIVSVGFYSNGDIFFEAMAEESDYEYDEIGAHLEIKQIEKEKSKTLKALRLWYLMYKTEYGDKMRDMISE
mgnify:CR=1 FL=1